MTKPTYDIDAPDQPRLKVARLEIEALLQKHDLAGVVVLHTPGMSEFFYNISPSYSVCWIDESARRVRIRSRVQREHQGDAAAQQRDQAATANMTAALAEDLRKAAGMFEDVDHVVTFALQAQHTGSSFVPDPAEAKTQ